MVGVLVNAVIRMSNHAETDMVHMEAGNVLSALVTYVDQIKLMATKVEGNG